MFTSVQMYSCYGFVNGLWLKGIDCGTVDTENGIRVVFISDADHRTKHYLNGWEINYSKEKPE